MLKVKDEPIVLSKIDFLEIFHLADMLGWEIDRMSSGGQGVYNNLMDKLEAALKKAGGKRNTSQTIYKVYNSSDCLVFSGTEEELLQLKKQNLINDSDRVIVE